MVQAENHDGCGHGHDHGHLTWFDHLSGVVLAAVMTWSWWQVRRHDCGCEDEADATTGSKGAATTSVPRTEFDVTGMNCSHCSSSVDRAIRELEGVDGCQVRLDDGLAVVEGAAVDPAAVEAAIAGLGFKAQQRPG